MKNWQLTKRQYLSLKYKYMKERVTDLVRSEGNRHYFGLPICRREEFVEFGLKDSKFNSLFKKYKRSKGKRAKSPSVDRIKSTRGYTLDNIQFLSLSDNVKKTKKDRWIVLQNTTTYRLHRFATAGEAGRFLGHKWHIKVERRSFTNLKTGEVFANATNRFYYLM